MKLDIDRIKSNLTTSFLGRDIVYFDEIASTQDEAKKQITNYMNGAYFVTDKQTSGKGTHGRIWYDNGYENICGSFILKPNCEIDRISGLTMVIAECIVKALKILYNINTEIKEPNDIMLNNKKLAGILTESVSNNGIVKHIIVGIGINVNQEEFQPEIENIATSLKREYTQCFDRELIIAEFFNIFEDKMKIMRIVLIIANWHFFCSIEYN